MMSLVYHCRGEPGVKSRQFPRDFDLVAAVRSTRVEEVFDLTISTDSHWSENRKVKTYKNSRSTTLGDVIVTPNGMYRLGFSGWEPVSMTLPQCHQPQRAKV